MSVLMMEGWCTAVGDVYRPLMPQDAVVMGGNIFALCSVFQLVLGGWAVI
jgi:hypothetical protein